MALMGIQQIMLGGVLGSRQEAKQSLQAVETAGFQAIELNGFMIRKTPAIVRMLTRFAGMPTGRSGNLNWPELLSFTGLKVVALHEALQAINDNPQMIADTARLYDTKNIVVTGMYRFDYSNGDALKKLAESLNLAGEKLTEHGLNLLYHNHNSEFLRIKEDLTAFEILIKNTDPRYLNFEFDSYWTAETGADPVKWMEKLGRRMRLYHINDRGIRAKGTSMTPILKSDSMELGQGNMNLEALIKTALQYDVEAIILESHRNWIDNSPVKSMQISAEFLRRFL